MTALVEQESWDKKIDMAFGNKFPVYVYILGVFVALDVIGIIYSAVWFLFLR